MKGTPLIKKGDIFVLVAALILIAASVVMLFSAKDRGNTVVVKQNNKTVYEGSLYQDKTLRLSGNTVKIKDKKVLMESADCKNQLCVGHKKISKKGESIVCLPNKVSVQIK